MASTRPPVTTDTRNNPHLQRAYAISNPNEGRDVYDSWAETYDDDMRSESLGYVAPAIAAQYVVDHSDGKIDPSHKFLDAGCGTGLVGIKLAEAGAKNIDGVDLSEGMLKIARKSGVYNELEPADLSQPIVKADNTYDAVVSSGTLTHGHVGPEAIQEFVRVTRDQGLVVTTILGDIWETQGYKAEVERLEKSGRLQVLGTKLEDYRRGGGVKAIMLIVRVTK